MARLSFTDVVTLKGNVKIPQLGFGVFASPASVCEASVLNAIKAGYRHIDTAQGYHNEEQVGTAVAKSGVPRDQLFITTKIVEASATDEMNYQRCLESVNKLDTRGTEKSYVDCFLVHTPKMGPQKRQGVWGVLERLQAEGKVRTIGVSNYSAEHIEQMKAYAKSWPPVINQIEVHPWLRQQKHVDYCRQHGIVVEAYCPMVRNTKADDATLAPIAKKLGVTPNQVLLRWSLQHGFVALPKSDNPDRQRQNADLYGFEISKDDMEALDNLKPSPEDACCPENIPDDVE